jgi:hypothetical protein
MLRKEAMQKRAGQLADANEKQRAEIMAGIERDVDAEVKKHRIWNHSGLSGLFR